MHIGTYIFIRIYGTSLFTVEMIVLAVFIINGRMKKVGLVVVKILIPFGRYLRGKLG